ncbi:MAG: restriction endonuclease [Alphaproteobacteria bacterium]|nr:restriction endonuclease [Alphaproteobacteria bacterium]
MTRLTASNLVKSIGNLPRNVDYEYPNPKTKGKIRIVSVEAPEGPINFKRFSPSKGKTAASAKTENISAAMIWRVANAVSTGQPVNLDRVLGGSYNSRSVLEALLAHTPEFSMCYPGRVQQSGSSIEIKAGHKHIWWKPEETHKPGSVKWVRTEKVISEIPVADAIYEAIPVVAPDSKVPEGIQRRHALMQISLIYIGKALKFQTSVAIEDQHIVYEGKRLSQIESVVSDLTGLQQVSSHHGAMAKIRHVDVVWFKNGKLMPAAIEIEHSTGIKSGLDRLRGLQDEIPGQKMRFVVVADQSERDRVVAFANEDRFKSLDLRFFPYPAVEELYSLCCRRKLHGVSEDFLDSFMEPVVVA